MIFEYTLLIISSYIIGSIPFAYIVVKIIKDMDIRSIGSGNIGATNVARVLGKWGFVSVLILDMLKGYIPVYLAYKIYGESLIVLLTVFAVILGHTYTIFLKFKGGKGVATASGAFLALSPMGILIALIFFTLTFFITKIVSLSSIVGSLALGTYVLFFEDWVYLKLLTTLIVVLIIWKHRSNILRILKGEESRFIKK